MTSKFCIFIKMRHQKKLPTAALAPFIKHYWYFETDERDIPFSQLSFPYGAFELICYLENPNTMRWLGSDDDFLEPAIFYAGQLTKPFVLTFTKRCKCVGVSLHPWAGNLLYDTPANHFTNELADLRNMEADSGLYDKLKQCANADALFNCLETYILKKLAGKQNDLLVYTVARQIMDNPTRQNLNMALNGAGLSRRRVEQRFIEATGLSMGLFTRKVRFQKTVHLLKNSPLQNLTALGISAGYYDQSHFIADFKAFAGAPPKSFRQQKTGLSDILNVYMQGR